MKQIYSVCVYSHAAAGQRHGIAVGAAAAEAGALRVLARGGAVARVRHVRAVHRALAVPDQPLTGSEGRGERAGGRIRDDRNIDREIIMK